MIVSLTPTLPRREREMWSALRATFIVQLLQLPGLLQRRLAPDINIPDGAVFQESAHVTPGESVTLAHMGETKVGLSVCYDLRFPELYRRLVRAGAKILCIPAAFTLHTGKDHWLPLLRARAIENECYVLAPAQFGRHSAERASYGKSCIVDPRGAIIAQVPDKDGYAMADLDLLFLQQVRQGLPCLEHIRLTTI